jgi:uncharacterized protein YqhQ
MKKERLPSYGGQALIEGVLMRGSHYAAAAMRNPKGEIIFETEELSGIYKNPIRNIPFLRGVVILWDALGLGMRYLTISANLHTGDDEKIDGPALYAILGIAIAFALLIFFVLPSALTYLAIHFLNLSLWASTLFEGVIQLSIVIGYLWLIGKTPDIKRVFMYHGAEHKTINAYEAGDDLISEMVTKQSLQHPRCGTSFLVTLILLSILFFAILGPLPVYLKIPLKLIMIIPLACIAYEYIRWTASHLDNAIIRILIIPNLALQKLTTRQPTQDMLEVSIAAFKQMVFLENEYQNDQNVLPEKTI